MDTTNQNNLKLIILITLAALALPLGLIAWGVTVWSRSNVNVSAPEVEISDEPNPAVEALRQVLEGVVDKEFPPPAAEEVLSEISLRVVDTGKTAQDAGRLASELGGVALDGNTEENARLVFSVPAEKISEFIRRMELLTGSKFPTQKIEGLFAITFTTNEL